MSAAKNGAQKTLTHSNFFKKQLCSCLMAATQPMKLISSCLGTKERDPLQVQCRHLSE